MAAPTTRRLAIARETVLMTQYQYKTVPFIGRVKSGEGPDAVAQQLTIAINAYAKDGWEFVQLGDINIEVKPGCLAGIFGARVSYTRFDQIVFRRTI
jgi:hypothetical protein